MKNTATKTQPERRRQPRMAAPLFLLLAGTLCAHAATFYVTISGLGGEPDYDQRFKMWADDIDGSLKRAGGEANVINLQAPTREQVRAKLTELSHQAKPSDALVLMLIGHGSFDGVEYKFNLPGPISLAPSSGRCWIASPPPASLSST